MVPICATERNFFRRQEGAYASGRGSLNRRESSGRKSGLPCHPSLSSHPPAAGLSQNRPSSAPPGDRHLRRPNYVAGCPCPPPVLGTCGALTPSGGAVGPGVVVYCSRRLRGRPPRDPKFPVHQPHLDAAGHASTPSPGKPVSVKSAKGETHLLLFTLHHAEAGIIQDNLGPKRSRSKRGTVLQSWLLARTPFEDAVAIGAR